MFCFSTKKNKSTRIKQNLKSQKKKLIQKQRANDKISWLPNTYIFQEIQDYQTKP